MFIPLQLEVTINLEINKKRGFFESSEKDKPPVLEPKSIKFTSSIEFDNDKVKMLKIFEYLLVSFYTQWKNQYSYRKYNDLKDYSGITFNFYQDGETLKCDNELPNGVLNSLLINIYIYVYEELLNIEMEDEKYRNAFYTIFNQSANSLLAEAVKASISNVIYKYVSSYLKKNI